MLYRMLVGRESLGWVTESLHLCLLEVLMVCISKINLAVGC